MISLLAVSLLASNLLYPELGQGLNPNVPEIYVVPETGPEREQREYQQRQERINEGPTQLQQERKAYDQRQRRIWCADHPGSC
jgi:hypothetical protein